MNLTTIFSLPLLPGLMTVNRTEAEASLVEFLTEKNDNENDLLSGYSPENSVFPLYLRLWATLASALIFIVGVGGNVLVPVLMWKNRQLRHSTNIFLLNLALADCLVLLICLPTALVELHTAPNAWVLGEALCRLVPFVEVSVVRASVFTLTVISVERYIAICKPLRASTLCTRPRAIGICLGIWPASFLAAGPVLVATEFQGQNSMTGFIRPTCMTPLREPWVSGYFLGSAIAFFLLPLIFLFSIYLFIARKLLNHRARSHKNIDNAQWKARKQVAGMLGAVVVIFFVCLLPFQVLIMWVIASPVQDISDLGPHTYFNVLFACRVLIYINAAANPVVYNAMSAKFRHAFLSLFGMSSRGSARALRRRSTLTTTFSSSSNASVSSRADTFRRIANLALKRSVSDASIRRPNGDRPRFSSPSIFSSPKGSPSLPRAKERPLEKWYLRRGTSGSYFSGDSTSNCCVFSEDALELRRPLNMARPHAKTEYSPLMLGSRNGHMQERNRSLPELFRSSPSLIKRVSFKDNVLLPDRPRAAVSPLAFTSLTERGGVSEPKLPKRKEKRRNKTKTKRMERKEKKCVRLFGLSQRASEKDSSSRWIGLPDGGLKLSPVELRDINKNEKRRRILSGTRKKEEEEEEEEEKEKKKGFRSEKTK